MIKCSLTLVTWVHPFSKQKAAELVLCMVGVLHLHQVGGHAEGVVLEVPLTLFTPAVQDGNRADSRHIH